MTQSSKFELEPREYLRVRGELNKMELSLEQLQDAHAALHTEYTLLQKRHKKERAKMMLFGLLFLISCSGRVLKEMGLLEVLP